MFGDVLELILKLEIALSNVEKAAIPEVFGLVLELAREPEFSLSNIEKSDFPKTC
ncbi:hypothetical protein Mal48_36380 [Thalassoglobus polymorphus]|uniref:Uncharacterized protein n=1 Tax=Thalassoglobus polymorphus TaxID=2527994 RepID=A0A517QRY5_9PLAN|nr:hypothetical protein Mal48_36380 [Thalassoglobus polymorphus]